MRKMDIFGAVCFGAMALAFAFLMIACGVAVLTEAGLL